MGRRAAVRSDRDFGLKGIMDHHWILLVTEQVKRRKSLSQGIRLIHTN